MDPSEFSFVVNRQHPGFGTRDQRWRRQRARANELPGDLAPLEQLGRVLRSGQSLYAHDDYAGLYTSGLTAAESL
eukprot:874865-Lingulodinium_polyedra.AAC.1